VSDRGAAITGGWQAECQTTEGFEGRKNAGEIGLKRVRNASTSWRPVTASRQQIPESGFTTASASSSTHAEARSRSWTDTSIAPRVAPGPRASR